MKKKGLIIFDMDGVVVDSVMLTYMYTKRTLPFMSWKMYQYIFDSSPFKKAIKIVSTLRGQNVTKKLAGRRNTYSKEKLESRIIPGIKGLLERLHQDYDIALNTNASDSNTLPILKKHNIEKYFTLIKTRDKTSDKSEKNKKILSELSYTAGETLFITDSIRDVEDAASVEIMSLGVTTGVHDRIHFEKRNIRRSVYAVCDNSDELEHAIHNFFNERQ